MSEQRFNLVHYPGKLDRVVGFKNIQSDIMQATFDIIYRDDHVIALDKSPGLLAVPGRGPEKHDSLATRVQAEFPEARVVHRLDMATSGVMLMALDADSHRELNWQFEQRRVKKRYVAEVFGRLEADVGEINQPIVKDFERPPRHKICHEQGREAISHWRVMERMADRTRVELSPVTGRSHQLRIHMHHLGHPILGDILYSPPEVQAMSSRLRLHAAEVTIMHPATGQVLTVSSEVPF